jgi:hypothetical protein
MDLHEQAIRRFLAVDPVRRHYQEAAPPWLLGFRTGPTREARTLIDRTIETIVQLLKMPYLSPRFHGHSGLVTQGLFDFLREFDGDRVGFALRFRLYIQGQGDLPVGDSQAPHLWDRLDSFERRYLAGLRDPLGPVTQDRAMFFLLPDDLFLRLTAMPDTEIVWLRILEDLRKDA